MSAAKVTCYLCGQQFAPDETVMDHIVPRSRGGSDGKRNRAPACKPCDARKSDSLLSELEWVSDETKAEYAHLEAESNLLDRPRSHKRLRIASKRIDLARLALNPNVSERQVQAGLKAIQEAKHKYLYPGPCSVSAAPPLFNAIIFRCRGRQLNGRGKGSQHAELPRLILSEISDTAK